MLRDVMFLAFDAFVRCCTMPFRWFGFNVVRSLRRIAAGKRRRCDAHGTAARACSTVTFCYRTLPARTYGGSALFASLPLDPYGMGLSSAYADLFLIQYKVSCSLYVCTAIVGHRLV